MFRPYWRHHFTGVHGVIYFVDSTDKERFTEARNELRILLVDSQLKNIPVVIFANKQDCPDAGSIEEITEALLLNIKGKSVENRDIIVMKGSCTNQTDILNTMEWLRSQMKPI